MSVAIQSALYSAVAAAATAAGAAQSPPASVSTYRGLAPATAVVPYVVISDPITAPPTGTYGNEDLERDLYDISVVAGSRLAAERIAEYIADELHMSALAGAYRKVRRGARLPVPVARPDSGRFVVGFQYTVDYQGGI